MTPYRQVRALYDADGVRVYQAYSNEIADAALEHGRFVSPPFSLTRMTWIKPSFLWMMYRSGWAKKDPGQARILAIDLHRSAFEEVLACGHLTHYDPVLPWAHEEWKQLAVRSPVLVQWDPERTLRHHPLDYRTIQIGLKSEAVRSYVAEWIATITDITPTVDQIRELVEARKDQEAMALLPEERPYPVDDAVRQRLAMT